MRPFSTYRHGTARPRSTPGSGYAAGALRLAAGRPNGLYRMDVLYDGDRYVPVSDFDAARGGVALGLRASGQGGLRVVVARTSSPDGVGHLLAAERSGARRDAGRRRRRPRARRAPADRSRPSGGSQPGHRPLLSAECRALPVRDVERRRRGALRARAGEQPLRPDRVRGRRGAGDARLRRRVDLERTGPVRMALGEIDAPPAAAGRRADHARQVPDELRAPGSGPARDQLSLAGLRPGRPPPRHRRDDTRWAA